MSSNKPKLIQESSKTDKYRRRMSELDQEIQDFKVYWKEIVDYINPRKGRYLDRSSYDRDNDGRNKHQKIINGAATKAVKVLASGMQGGLTSPSVPWFVLDLPDDNLMGVHSVSIWLEQVRDIMLKVFAQSNFYSSAYNFYIEIATAGTGCMLIEEDFETGIRCRNFTVGEYLLGSDSKQRIDSMYHKYNMTSLQMYETFGYDNLSTQVQSALDNRNFSSRFEVVHLIQPNGQLDLTKEDAAGMLYESVYYEEATGDKDKFLRKAGFRTKPFVASRWDVTGVDTYGESPAMDALGDIKMLQKLEEKKLKALDKIVDPPMNATSKLRAKGGTVVPGGVNYFDEQQGGTGFSPSYQINLDVSKVGGEIRDVENRINRFFFNDLFLAIIGTDKENMTATEVARRHEEKLSQLGAVIERVESEFLDPLITRAYDVLSTMGVFPPKPQELLDAGFEPSPDYISMLSQAQRLVNRSSIESTVAFVGNLAGIAPEVLDKIDMDAAVAAYAESSGIPAKVLRSDEQVAQIREAKAQAAAEEKQRVDMQENIEGAKLLSETKVNEDNALSLLQGGAGGI